MMGEVRKGGHIDWLGRNKFMRAAAKKYGVTNNAQLKALVALSSAHELRGMRVKLTIR